VDPFPPRPRLDDAPAALLDDGHLWLEEHVLGARLRFRVTDRGLVFGDADGTFDPWGEPFGVRAAVDEVRERFDADAFAAGVDTPSEYTFLGIATRNEGIDYAWDRLPAFLGTDVRGPDGDLVTVDTAVAAFDGFGLDARNSVEREVPARHFQPDRHAVPDSAWYEGPAAGTVVRRKDGPRALLPGATGDSPSEQLDAAAFVERYATADAIDAVADALGDDPSVDATVDRLLSGLVRRRYHELSAADGAALRAAATEPVARRLG
jgi:hypothetical protein